MALPDGGDQLLCPVGPDYSQVGDLFFDAWDASPTARVVPISAEVFAKWFSNVKTATVTRTTISSVDGDISTDSPEPICQWRTDEFGPVEKNLGDHPIPSGGAPGYVPDYTGGYGITTPHGRYFLEADPGNAFTISITFPFVFVHKDEFYFLYYLIYGESNFTSVNLDLDKYEVVYTFVGAATITDTIAITINSTFY